MRWKQKESPREGDEKTKVSYLFLPLTLNKETRWLEFAKIKYKYLLVESWEYMDMGAVETSEYKWVHVEFLPYDPVKDCEIYKTEGCAHVDGMICNIEECNQK